MTTRYELITCLAVASHEGGFTGAMTTTVSLSKFPNSPGCMADGQTYADAVANAEVVIDEWIAVTQRGSARPGFPTARKLGRPIPEPRGKLAYA